MNDTILELADVIDSLHETPEYLSVGVPMVRVVDINNNFLQLDNCFLVDQETCDRHNKNHIPQKGDVIITRVGSYGMLAYVDIDSRFCLGQNIAIISPYKAEDGKFLYYYLKSPYIQNIIYGNSGGSSYKCIGLEQIKKLPLMIDGIERDRIGDLLYQIDSKIENNRRISYELEARAKTIFDYWFLQFDFPDKNGKPYKSSGGKMVWSEALKREIPEAWEVSSLRGKYSIERGLTYTSKDIESGEGVPMINLACIDIKRKYKDGELKYYNGKVPDNMLLSAGDLLIACTDLTRNADIVGSPILVPNDGQKYVYSMDIAKLIPHKDCFNPYYFYMVLRTDFYHKYIKRWASGTNVLHLNLDGLNWYTVWIPPMELQNNYGRLIEDINKEKSVLLQENKELVSLRDFLLPLLMNGQVGFKEC